MTGSSRANETERRRDRTMKLFSTSFTAMVNCGDILPRKRALKLTRGAKRKQKPASADNSSVRATISFPTELYRTLEEIAGQKKVSLAWVVREAAEQYIADKWPLFKGKV
jgi:Ribbon-helix-helix protein, copG family